MMIKNTYIKEWNEWFADEPDYDDFITNDEFRQFLIDNNCYDQYIYNCKNSAIHKDFMKNFSKEQKYDYIINAFTWHRVPEDPEFWDELSNKWYYYYNKKKNENYKYIKEWVDYGFEEEPVYDDFITNDQFRQFLIDNGCLREYIYNCKNDKAKMIDDFMDRFPRLGPCSYIMYAFVWENTPEGNHFWTELNQKWVSILEKDWK